MVTPKTVLRLLRPDAVERIIYLLLLWALVPLGEIVLMLYLGTLVGTWLVLAAAAATVLVGALVALRELRSDIAELMHAIAAGEVPGRELEGVAGVLLAAFLLASPGFLTDIIGLVIMSAGMRRRVGAVLLERLGVDAKEIYEYLRLSEAELTESARGGHSQG